MSEVASTGPVTSAPVPRARRGIRWRREPLAVGAVAVILGILSVGQFRGQQGVPGLSNLSAQELGVLVANLNAQNDQLRAQIATLQREQTDLAAAKARGESALEQLQSDLATIRAWAGVTALNGPGVSISVEGPIGSDGVEDLVNELRNAGAEGISLAGVRLVPGEVVAGSAGSLTLDGNPLGPGFEIDAVGSPQIITGTLTRAGGVIAQIATTYPNAQITVTPRDGIQLPPTARTLIPPHGAPRL
jgi:uncharacterized protein YlxW (UPF0749 family)